MLYSVYNVGTQAYDYYDGPGPKATHAGVPSISNVHELGATVDSAAWKLPMGSRPVGSGPMPKGRIASSGMSGSLGDFGGDIPKLGILAVAAYLAWRYLR